MRKITRDNYEVWLLDKMEGRLSEEEVGILNAFLLCNPDLEAEMDDSAIIFLPDYRVNYSGKEKLRKAPSPFEELSEYEYTMVNALEEGAQYPMPEEQMSENDKMEWALFKKTRLEPELVVYPAKNSLKRHRTPLWINICQVAAAVVLLLLLLNIDGLFISDSSQSDLIADKGLNSNRSESPATITEELPNMHEDTEITPAITTAEEVKQVKSPLPDQNQIQTAISEKWDTQAPKSTIDSDNTIPVEYQRAPDPGRYTDLLAVSTPDPYEQGLKLMIPQYISNSLIINESRANELASFSSPDDRPSLASSLLRRINPVSNLSFGNIYDEEGELVAINISADGFELTRRVPSWVNYLR